MLRGCAIFRLGDCILGGETCSCCFDRVIASLEPGFGELGVQPSLVSFEALSKSMSRGYGNALFRE